MTGPTTVTVSEVMSAAYRHGVRLSFEDLHDAVRSGDLRPANRCPLRFTQDEANRWLGTRSGR